MITVYGHTTQFALLQIYLWEGREGVKWELGFAFFRGWEMGFCALGLGFMKEKTKEKWEWDFNLNNTGWDCGI